MRHNLSLLQLWVFNVCFLGTKGRRVPESTWYHRSILILLNASIVLRMPTAAVCNSSGVHILADSTYDREVDSIGIRRLAYSCKVLPNHSETLAEVGVDQHLKESQDREGRNNR